MPVGATASIGPLVAGSSRPAWQVTVKQQSGSAFALTGATFTGTLKHRTSSRSVSLTTGNYAITDATAGIFTYSPTSTETTDPGAYIWETVITISSQPTKVQVPVLIVQDMT